MKLEILPEAKAKLDLYVEHADSEISGFGLVRTDGLGVFTCYDILIEEQECTSAHTQNPMPVLRKFTLERKDILPFVKLYWHSHPNFGVSPSGEDTAMAASWKNEWMLSLIANKRKEYYVRLDVYNPCHLVVEKIPLEVVQPEYPSLSEAIKAEVAAKVKKPTYSTSYNNYSYDGKQTTMTRVENGVRKEYVYDSKLGKMLETVGSSAFDTKDYKFDKGEATGHYSNDNKCPQCGYFTWSQFCKCELSKDVPPLNKRERKLLKKLATSNLKEAYEYLTGKEKATEEKKEDKQ